MKGLIAYILIMSSLIGLAIWRVETLPKAPIAFECPLAKQGCTCGHICTKDFDCVRGDHR